MAKPKVTVNPVANQYTAKNERIIEYSHNGLGGLIAFRATDDGNLLVELYRHDEGVKIRVAPIENPNTWTFVGHWEDDEIVVEYVLPGEQEDVREDKGFWEQGLFAASATAPTQDEALAQVRDEYETQYKDEESDTPDLTTSTCRYCDRAIVLDPKEGWIDPEAGYDDEDGDGIWRVTCDANDTFTAEHAPTPTPTQEGRTMGDLYS